MHWCLRLIVCAAVVALPLRAVAQEAIQDPVAIQDSGTAYLRAIRLHGIDADVAYYDPTGPAPQMRTSQEPPAQRDPDDRPGETGDLDTVFVVVSVAILVGIVFIFGKYGGRFSASFGQEAGNATRRRRKTTRAGADLSAEPGDLRDILRTADRRLAVMRLAQAALLAAASANDLLLQRSWTARDILRHLPADQSHMEALRKLVLASERVHFGGRDVSEEDFQTFVAEIRTLLPKRAV